MDTTAWSEKALPRLNLIYEPTGRAREYAPLAINIYNGCTHACLYCYGAKSREEMGVIDYRKRAKPKAGIVKKLERDIKVVKKHFGNKVPEVLLSFLGDPYQPAELELKLTRSAIEVLIEHNLPFTILTKGGTRAVRDFDLLETYSRCSFGTTLVFVKNKDTSYWEPGAASPLDRVYAIQKAKLRGIKTWVSLEPVINPEQALEVIRRLHSIVDHWKVGKVNHMPELEAAVDWWKFTKELKALLKEGKADYYLKHSLRKYDRKV